MKLNNQMKIDLKARNIITSQKFRLAKRKES